MKDFIRLKIEMLKDGYSLEQIKKECWQYALKEGIGVLTIDATIQLAMEIYASVIKEYHKPFGSGGTTSEQLQPLFKKLSDLGVIALTNRNDGVDRRGSRYYKPKIFNQWLSH
jgi:heterodisulfide reductase subunit A-like polyferredoxin